MVWSKVQNLYPANSEIFNSRNKLSRLLCKTLTTVYCSMLHKLGVSSTGKDINGFAEKVTFCWCSKSKNIHVIMVPELTPSLFNILGWFMVHFGPYWAKNVWKMAPEATIYISFSHCTWNGNKRLETLYVKRILELNTCNCSKIPFAFETSLYNVNRHEWNFY